MGTKALKTDAHILILGVIQASGQHHGHDLPKHGGSGSALDPHLGHTRQTKDQDGVQNDVDNGPCSLGDHAVEGLPRGLEDPLEHHFPKQAKAENADDLQVLNAVFNDNGIICLAFKEQPCPKQAKDCKYQKA